jgi:hypothetical protein
MFAACTQLAGPLTQSYLRFPTDVLEAFREVFQAELPMTAHVGRRAIRPHAFDQGTAGMCVAGFCDTTLATPFPTGVFRWRQAQVAQELAGVFKRVRSPSSATRVMGECLCKDHPHTLRGMTLLEEGPEHYAAWKHLPALIKEGQQNAFGREFGQTPLAMRSSTPAMGSCAMRP